MQVGDLEFTRHVNITTDVANESMHETVSFAVGIKTRPLLTRVGVFPSGASAVTGTQAVFLENGVQIAENSTFGTLALDARAIPLWMHDNAISATGFVGTVVPFQTDWWKLLLPDIQIIVVDVILSAVEVNVTLHYRFATLTDDEILELAAQRAQS
jgi:hypothetical protein